MEQLHETGEPWRRVGPSSIAAGPEWSVPEALSLNEIAEIRQMFVDGAKRADRAGFDVLELHFGHGYLVASFLSRQSNLRTDGYGGPRTNRMRLGLEIAGDVRSVWPEEKPLFVRISAVDGTEDGWGLDDSVALAQELKTIGVDVIDCSSGGLSDETRNMNVPRGLGFQVPFSERIRRAADVKTQAVGVILDGHQAEAILQEGKADLIAIGRQALYDPYWPHHAAHALDYDSAFENWPIQHGPWLAKRAPLMEKLKFTDNSVKSLTGSGRQLGETRQ
jgi:2,4-dienoyl-CoA reductase-like NADH-dependent reductase (Old Yellow Enzyme family)